MKIKHILALFVLGVCVVVLGALFKIQHWPGASKMLIVGMIAQVVSGILFIWKLLTMKDSKDFLNK